MGEIDSAFVQEQEHRPKLSIIEAQGIPEIDLSPLFHHQLPNPSAIEGLVKEIGSACKEWGFFQVTNHGVPLSLRQKLEESSRLFFAQSLEEKKKVARDAITPTGYHDTEHTKNVRDGKEVFDFLAKDPTLVPLNSDENDNRVIQWSNPSPQYPPHFRYLFNLQLILIMNCN